MFFFFAPIWNIYKTERKRIFDATKTDKGIPKRKRWRWIYIKKQKNMTEKWSKLLVLKIFSFPFHFISDKSFILYMYKFLVVTVILTRHQRRTKYIRTKVYDSSSFNWHWCLYSAKVIKPHIFAQILLYDEVNSKQNSF